MADKQWLLADKSGKEILAVKSVIEVGVKSDGNAVFEPIEQGSFSTYNKTRAPLEIQAVLGFEGTVQDLMGVIDDLQKLKENAVKFSLVTPYKEFENMTLERFDTKFQREDGIGSLYANCILIEVKENAVEYSSKDPSDYKTVHTGATTTTSSQNQEVEKARKASLANKIFG